MPIRLDTDMKSSSFENIKIDDYDYPDGLDLSPKSKLHKKIKDKIIRMANASGMAISERFASWNKMDNTLNCKIELDQEEKDVQIEDKRKPVSIIYPHTSAILDSLLSYLCAAFFQQPMFRYEGVSPEDTIGAIMMEKVIDVHTNKSKVALNLHTQFRDGLTYGFGVVAPVWDKVYGYKTIKKPYGFIDKLANIFKATEGFYKDQEEAILFEGNKLVNIDPYLCLPDPNVSIHEFQDGEFFGWVDSSNYMDLLSEEKNNEDYFNVKYLRGVQNKTTSIYGKDKSGRSRGESISVDTTVTKPVDVIYMYVKLIPRDWKLGKSEYPEKWMFALAADEVLIMAKPIGLDHDKFPVSICAPDFDGYSSSPISRLETLEGLQHVLNWLFNTHISNVRKAINDMFVADPFSININDLKNPRSGKIIRTRRPVWGRGVKDMVQQLVVNDVTRQNIADSGHVINAMEKVGGADSSQMGALRQGGPERLTGAEFKGTERGGFSRLERVARIIGLQSMQDLGYFFASHTQQFMEEELYLKTTGRWQETLMQEFSAQVKGGRMKVSPFDVLVDYDLLVRDGSIPGNNYSDVWMKMFEVLTKDPELRQQFEIGRIFKHIARNNGAKNVDEFVKIKVQPDEQVQQQEQAGNVVPMQALGGQV